MDRAPVQVLLEGVDAPLPLTVCGARSLFDRHTAPLATVSFPKEMPTSTPRPPPHPSIRATDAPGRAMSLCRYAACAVRRAWP